MKVLRSATQDDLWALQVFLRRANISIVDLEDKIEDFIILEEENEGICGTIGIEEYGNAGLLRSLVIGPSVKQFQLLQMFEHTQQHARKKGLEQLYLVTNKNNFIQFFRTAQLLSTAYTHCTTNHARIRLLPRKSPNKKDAH
ncbi:GNAT family N-acetyltransferase [Bacillus sp. m3-13]|uniref:GNAT family N-acetyltransferase n=1 Tax=Bacillus sp. m3-13 TaxID=406124 RepID=UPI0001E89F05|nr:hypothetical protein [Bacillus sp. m3-13]